jgi:hypothetical protein
MKATLHDDQCFALHTIDEPMLLRDSPRPPAFQVPFQRLGFANTRKRTADCIANQLIDLPKNLAIRLLPINVVLPSAGKPCYSHRSRISTRPAAKSSSPRLSRSAFAGVDSKCSVSCIAAKSCAANNTAAPLPSRVIVIGSPSRSTSSKSVPNRAFASTSEMLCMFKTNLILFGLSKSFPALRTQ